MHCSFRLENDLTTKEVYLDICQERQSLLSQHARKQHREIMTQSTKWARDRGVTLKGVHTLAAVQPLMCGRPKGFQGINFERTRTPSRANATRKGAKFVEQRWKILVAIFSDPEKFNAKVMVRKRFIQQIHHVYMQLLKVGVPRISLRPRNPVYAIAKSWCTPNSLRPRYSVYYAISVKVSVQAKRTK